MTIVGSVILVSIHEPSGRGRVNGSTEEEFVFSVSPSCSLAALLVSGLKPRF